MSGSNNDRRTVKLSDGEDLTRSSEFDGESFVLRRNDSTLVENVPVLHIEDDDVRFTNFGSAASTGQTATIQVDGDDARVANARHAEISAEDTAIRVTGEDARITNFGDIEGGVNGVDFANNGESSGKLANFGTISSDSRAVNIGGEDIVIANAGEIVGTGDQRNGTIYSNGTADDFKILNYRHVTIDAGEGNQGAAIALQIGDEAGESIEGSIFNAGDIVGRGQGAANTGLAGDGIRIFAGAEDTTFEGNIVNNGSITSESTQGPVAGIRVSNGVNFEGQIINGRHGEIAGANNGVYFGTGEHDAQVRNFGTISSDSRAVNIDGSGVDLINHGDIVGTGDQRNGTVYADGTAEDYSILNGRRGTIDAGEGNNGSAVSLQTGDIDGDTVEASVYNAGSIYGRGDAEAGNTVGDGVRVFSNQEDVTFEGNIYNAGKIIASEDSDEAAAISIEDGVTLDGKIVNRGLLEANETAIDASEAGGSVTVVNSGRIDGNVVLSDGDDTFDGSRSRFDTEVDAGAGEDRVLGGRGKDDLDGGSGDDFLSGGCGNDLLTGGLGDDALKGGKGYDTASFLDLDVPVTIDLQAGTAVRETGFSLSFEDAPVDVLTLNPNQSGNFVTEALNGNLYFNIHTADFGGGEIRGQLDTIVDDTVDGTGTITISGGLDAAQEPGPLSDSDATGQGTVTIQVVDGVATGYSVELDVEGLATADLTPVAIFSAIHLHNAPRGENGPVALDVVQDAGADVDGNVLDETVFGEVEGPGFTVEVVDQALESLTTEQSPEEITNEALHGNLYFNVHTSDFPGGEIRGQLELDSVKLQDGVKTITLNAVLDSAQEPNGTSDSDATGTATVTIVVDGDDFTYSASLDVQGIEPSDLLPVAGVSSIHLHNAPAGQNGPVITDIIQDAGGDVNGVISEGGIDTGDGNVFVDTFETDTLNSIENVLGSNDSDVLLGDRGKNELVGNDGDDVLNGRQGNDLLEGGAGADTFVFEEHTGRDVVRDFDGFDLLDLSSDSFAFESLEDVQNAAHQAGDDVIIDLGRGDQVTLQDAYLDQLTSESVLF